MNQKRRVVITGMGVITPLGEYLDDFWTNLMAGNNGVGPIETFETDELPVTFAGEIKEFDIDKYLEKSEIRKMDRGSHFSVVSSAKAMEDSGLDLDQTERTRVGVIMGTGIGGIIEHWHQTQIFLKKGARRVSPFFIPRLMPNAVSANVAIKLKLNGPNFSLNSACASGAQAQMLAAQFIETDQCDVVVTGGTEACLWPLAIAGFANCKALSRRNDEPQKACRPFDKDRDGFVMGEGAGALVFEELEHAKKRGAKIYAEILGWATNDDGYHITAFEPSGKCIIENMKQALKNAELTPQDISYINAHGTSTQLNDATETKAIKAVFGDHAYNVPISSTKSMIGHLIGAAGAVESVVSALSIQNGSIHPTINHESPDPECDLDYVPNEGRECEVTNVLSNSFGFGGHNASLVIGKYVD